MAELTDDFSTDPSGRWTNELGSAPIWDNVNGEYDIGAGLTDAMDRYSAAAPGSLDQEAQVTGQVDPTATSRLALAGVRIANDGTDDGYGVFLQVGTGLLFVRYNAGVRTSFGPFSVTVTAGNFYTVRLSATTTGGSNVDLDAWIVDHGSSKPADPGWIGTVGAPDFEQTDSSGLVTGSLHTQAGICGRTGNTDYDTRHDYWRARTIADRDAGASLTWLPSTTIVHGPTFKTIASGAIPPLSH